MPTQATHLVQDLYTLGQVGSLYLIAYCVTHFVIMVAFALYVRNCLGQSGLYLHSL